MSGLLAVRFAASEAGSGSRIGTGTFSRSKTCSPCCICDPWFGQGRALLVVRPLDPPENSCQATAGPRWGKAEPGLRKEPNRKRNEGSQF